MGSKRAQADQERFEGKLARALLVRQLVTREGLLKALKQQVILGGHLATNLWELNLVEGSTLSLLSAQILGVAAALPSVLADVPAKVLRLLPREFVERAGVVPMRQQGAVLQVATAEPWDLQTLGEAARLGGHPVEPLFLAEVPLRRFIQQHYGIEPSAGFRLRAEATLARSEGATRGKAAAVAQQEGPETAALVHPPDSNKDAGKQIGEIEPIADLERACAELEAATTRRSVGAVLLRFALSCGKRAALFVRRGDSWAAWMGGGKGVDCAALHDLLLPTEPHTIFGLVARTGAYYVGPVGHARVPEPLLKTLGTGKAPRSVAFLPVHFGGKVAFGVYLDAGGGADVSTELAELLVLAQKVPAALDRLIQHRMVTRQGEVAGGGS